MTDNTQSHAAQLLGVWRGSLVIAAREAREAYAAALSDGWQFWRDVPAIVSAVMTALMRAVRAVAGDAFDGAVLREAVLALWRDEAASIAQTVPLPGILRWIPGLRAALTEGLVMLGPWLLERIYTTAARGKDITG